MDRADDSTATDSAGVLQEDCALGRPYSRGYWARMAPERIERRVAAALDKTRLEVVQGDRQADDHHHRQQDQLKPEAPVAMPGRPFEPSTRPYEVVGHHPGALDPALDGQGAVFG